jgi:hypothetical protein
MPTTQTKWVDDILYTVSLAMINLIKQCAISPFSYLKVL